MIEEPPVQRLTMLVLALSCVSACAGDSPAGPSINQTAQVAGLWRGTATTASVSGGECFASVLQGAVGGSGAIAMTLTQNGSAVSATLPSSDSTTSYTYSGKVESNTLTLTGTCSGCDGIGVACPTGAMRDLKLQSSNITATVNGNTLSGSEVEIYNVLVSQTTTSVGTLSVTDTFSLTRQ
jgi:hypothetical protein